LALCVAQPKKKQYAQTGNARRRQNQPHILEPMRPL
jgi:hypothetical protein